jgi:hypothetical protein
MVELSVHVTFVPLEASASKFSVSGTPNAVILPPFVNANEDCTYREILITTQKVMIVIKSAMERTRGSNWPMDFNIDRVLSIEWLCVIRLNVEKGYRSSSEGKRVCTS